MSSIVIELDKKTFYKVVEEGITEQIVVVGSMMYGMKVIDVSQTKVGDKVVCRVTFGKGR